MDESQKGNKLSAWQIISVVVIPLLIVLLPLIFGDTPFARAFWGRVLAPTEAPVSAVLAMPIGKTEVFAPTFAPTAENTATETSTPAATPTVESTATITPVALVCPWSSFINGEETSSLSGEGCLNDLNSFGISSENDQKLSFYLSAWKKPGIYGVCTDISTKKEISFHLDLKDNLTAGRFLIALSQSPAPNKLSDALRFQYDNKDLHIKTLKYSEAGVDSGSSFITAYPLWKKFGGIWGFDVKLSISGGQLKGTINGVNVFSTQMGSPARYLCFAYQANQGLTATQLDAKVTFP